MWKKKPGGMAAGFSCSIPCPAKTVTGSTCAEAGHRPGSYRTMRCFPMAGFATPPSCGSVWSDDQDIGPSFRDGALAPDPESRGSGFDATHHPGMTLLMHPQLSGFPADHRLLAGDAPVVTGQRAALAERAVAGHHERDRVFSHCRPDRA